MDTVKYMINDNEFGYFIIKTETDKIINLDENGEEYKDYLDWVSMGNSAGKWNSEGIIE
jgi:hypothetical protein